MPASVATMPAKTPTGVKMVTCPRTERKRPSKAAKAIASAAFGLSQRQVAKASGLAKTTARDVMIRNADTIAKTREHTAHLCADLAKDAFAHARDRLDECSPSQLAIIGAVATDKSLLLTGETGQGKGNQVNIQVNVLTQQAPAIASLAASASRIMREALDVTETATVQDVTMEQGKVSTG